MKTGYVLLDGCADRDHPALNYTTPLEAANTPFLDALARRSRMGRVVTVGRGISPESDIAVFNMLGYSFKEGYPGRGVVEAVGSGLDIEDGYLAMRANFATVEKGLITDRRAGRDLTEEEAKALEAAISHVELKGAEFKFRSTVGYRGVLVIKVDGERLSAEIGNTDPAYIRVRGFGAATQVGAIEKTVASKPLERTRAAKRAAELVNEFSEKAMAELSACPTNRDRLKAGKKSANAVLLRDAGDHLPGVESFREKYGVQGVALVDMPTEVGIARLLKMKMVVIEDRADLEKKAKLFKRELSEGAIVYAHIKGPDEFGHDGDAVGKKKNIDSIDRQFFGTIGDRADTRIAVSCDHATPCILKMHSSDPVPLLITTTKGNDVACSRFTEDDAKKGSLKTMKGADVLSKVIELD